MTIPLVAVASRKRADVAIDALEAEVAALRDAVAGFNAAADANVRDMRRLWAENAALRERVAALEGAKALADYFLRACYCLTDNDGEWYGYAAELVAAYRAALPPADSAGRGD